MSALVLYVLQIAQHVHQNHNVQIALLVII